MKIIKSFNQGLLYKTYKIDGSHYLVSSLLSCFSFATPYSTILPETDLWKFLPTAIGESIFDLGVAKPTGEVLVSGSYFSRNGTPVSVGKTRIQIATVTKELVIWGNRFWKRPSSATWDISSPQPFSELPISYEYSYGGDTFPFNPIGKGHLNHDKPQKEPIPLPNIEYPAHLISSPMDRPEPAGMGPLDLMWPQRSSKTGTYDDNWLNTRFPAYAEDLNTSFFNTAPEDQQIKGFFNGDESFEVANMHQEDPIIKSSLPAIRARCFVNQQGENGTVLKEVKTNLDTVWLFPNNKFGILIYRGIQLVEDSDAEDVLHQMIAYEFLKDNPRSINHYEKALAQRLDKEKGQYHLLNESPLIPEGEKSGLAELIEDSDKASSPSENILAKNMAVRAERAKEETKQHLASFGVDPEKYIKDNLDDHQLPEFDMENPDRLIDQMEKLVEDAKSQEKDAEESMKNKLAQLGVDFDQLKKNSKDQGGRPKIGIDEKIAILKQFELLTPEIEKHLLESQEKLDQAYREYGHYMPASSDIPFEESQEKRQIVISGIESGGSFSGIDLSGADLSELDLQECDFSETFMEGVDLSASDLSNSNLSGCALMRSKLNGTKFDSANLQATNFGQAHCHRTKFNNAIMSNSVFYEATIENAIFSNCTLEEADFSKAVITNCTISGSVFNRCRFMESKLEMISFKGSECKETIFLNAAWKDIDFSDTDLTATICVGVNGDGSVFQRANLTNLRTAAETSFVGCDFRNANLTEATLRDINCNGSDFSFANISNADFGKCNLKNANFFSATAIGTQFVKADLTYAKMAGINLCEGSLQKACLHETDLHASNLYSVDFIEAKFRNTNISGANRKKAFLERWIKS